MDETFGRWTVIGDAPLRDYGRQGTKRYLLCRCACGSERPVQISALKNGNSRSCGCLARELLTKHGYARWHEQAAEYRIWKGMRARCGNQRSQDWPDYGGRGITVCVRWLDFANFIADMGLRPSPKYSLDRIENDGHYEPGNCRWATAIQQASNSRRTRLITFNGETLTLSAWARRVGITPGTLHGRLAKNRPMAEALSH